jgi:hypothetical protein
MKHKMKFTEVAEATELTRRSNFTTMAPPKQEEPRKTARKPIVKTRAQTQSQGSEQQPPEVINVEEIPSLGTTPRIPTLVVEETQQTTHVGMDIDRPKEGQGRQNEDASSQAQPENPEEALRVNGTAPNQEEVVEPDESQIIMLEHP